MTADPIISLTERLVAGDVAALARVISILEGQGKGVARIMQSISAATSASEKPSHVVGFTGPPGAGKSTLINALVRQLRREGRTVAVIAVDPSSPLTGGAVLGDRTRMGEHIEDDGVYIRSVASRGHLGGLSANIHRIIAAVEAAKWDVIILETVGAGQSETEVAELADVRVVINAPGLGDDIQAIKAGILEIADILVVNKGDNPLAERTERQLKAMLNLRSAETTEVPILTTIATEGQGLDKLSRAIDQVVTARSEDDQQIRSRRRLKTMLAKAAAERTEQLVKQMDPETISHLLDNMMSGDDDVRHVTDQVLQKILQKYLSR